ncbi:HesA/MoeB/ThiF family protein [Zavarzinia sp. CC-PAN008]|uniref:HesA/MoeB/ThiF family protein n=1 Tax=Zavarzinia sp. CC-PAN008 TaxID=3243332 RepID=UPI003F749FEF
MALTDLQLDRYARHIVLKEVGGAGQQRLLRARVLMIGAGGLGSAVLPYLAAAGVGTIGVVDDDVVSLSNLQRQILHDTALVNRPKTESAAAGLARINPEVRVVAHRERLVPANAMRLVSDYDLVIDGSDTFETRFLVNDACYFARRTLVSAALGRFEGQLATFKPHAGDHPCYRCLFPGPPAGGQERSCAEGGILGAVAGVMGTLQAVEVLKELLDLGESLAGRLLLYDALRTETRTIRLRRDPACALCGSEPTITTPPGA